MVGEIIAVIILAIVITAIFTFGFRTAGPWGTFWTFLLVIILGIWMAAIWIQPIGPIWRGAAWLDLLFIGILLALILAAATPTGSSYNRKTPTTNRSIIDKSPAPDEETDATVAIGAFFWVMFTIFALVIIVDLIV